MQTPRSGFRRSQSIRSRLVRRWTDTSRIRVLRDYFACFTSRSPCYEEPYQQADGGNSPKAKDASPPFVCRPSQKKRKSWRNLLDEWNCSDGGNRPVVFESSRRVNSVAFFRVLLAQLVLQPCSINRQCSLGRFVDGINDFYTTNCESRCVLAREAVKSPRTRVRTSAQNFPQSSSWKWSLKLLPAALLGLVVPTALALFESDLSGVALQWKRRLFRRY